MIVFQSSAIVKSANHLAHRSPSPGGEGRGEGELNCSSGRKPALIKVGGSVLTSRASCHFVHSVQAYPRLPKPAAGFSQGYPSRLRTFSKPIQACPRLSKVILEKKDCLFLASPK